MKESARFTMFFDCSVKALVLIFLLSVVMTGSACAEAGRYEGHGISFSYPEKYTLSTSVKKSDEVILLKNGSEAISVRIMKNRLYDGFSDVVIDNINNRFKEKGYGTSDAKKENKQIPLKVKGEDDPVFVDAVKFNHLVTIVQNKITINLKQTMFFFSYDEHGYAISFDRVSGKYSDLVQVLSSFSFDQREQPESHEDAGVY